jgi:hypothetical protein
MNGMITVLVSKNFKKLSVFGGSLFIEDPDFNISLPFFPSVVLSL